MRAVSRASSFVRKNAPPEASEETGGGRGEEKPKIVLFFRSVVFLFALRICPNSSSCLFPFHPEAPGKPTRRPFLRSKSGRMPPFLPVKTFRDSFSSSALDEKTEKIGQKMPVFPLFRSFQLKNTASHAVRKGQKASQTPLLAPSALWMRFFSDTTFWL